MLCVAALCARSASADSTPSHPLSTVLSAACAPGPQSTRVLDAFPEAAAAAAPPACLNWTRVAPLMHADSGLASVAVTGLATVVQAVADWSPAALRPGLVSVFERSHAVGVRFAGWPPAAADVGFLETIMDTLNILTALRVLAVRLGVPQSVTAVSAAGESLSMALSEPDRGAEYLHAASRHATDGLDHLLAKVGDGKHTHAGADSTQLRAFWAVNVARIADGCAAAADLGGVLEPLAVATLQVADALSNPDDDAVRGLLDVSDAATNAAVALRSVLESALFGGAVLMEVAVWALVLSTCAGAALARSVRRHPNDGIVCAAGKAVAVFVTGASAYCFVRCLPVLAAATSAVRYGHVLYSWLWVTPLAASAWVALLALVHLYGLGRNGIRSGRGANAVCVAALAVALLAGGVWTWDRQARSRPYGRFEQPAPMYDGVPQSDMACPPPIMNLVVKVETGKLALHEGTLRYLASMPGPFFVHSALGITRAAKSTSTTVALRLL